MLEKLEQIKTDALDALQKAQDEASLEEWRVAYLGRKSPVMDVFSQMGGLSAEERPAVGRNANIVKKAIEAAFDARVAELREAALQESLQTEKLDVTLPGRNAPQGRLHPVTQTMREINKVFADMGFQVYRSRDIETDAYNFQLLNFPAEPPGA